MPEGDINHAVDLFKSRDVKKRREAIDLAASLDSREAAALMIKALQDQSWSLREYAIGKGADLGSPLVGPLCRLLRSGVWYSRAAAVKVLELIGDRRALLPLSAVLGDGNRSVADAAKSAFAALLGSADAGQLQILMQGTAEPARKRFIDAVAAIKPELGVQMAGGEAAANEDPSGEDAGQTLQQLRSVLKSASKQEPKYEEDES
jgi:HEAT repeat protein